MTGQFHDVDPSGPVLGEVIDPHAFDSQIGKVVNLTANGEVIGRVRLTAAKLTGDGWHFELATVRAEELVAPAPEPEPVEAPQSGHEHRWRQIGVDGNEYRTVDVADPRPPMPQPGLVCEGPGSCPVIDDPDRGAWARRPLNVVLEGDPRE